MKVAATESAPAGAPSTRKSEKTADHAGTEASNAKAPDAKTTPAKPSAAKSAQAKSAETKSAQAKSADVKPAPAKKPVSAKAAKVEPTKAKATPAKSEPAKSTPAKPAQAKPVAAKPTQAKPATKAAPAASEPTAAAKPKAEATAKAKTVEAVETDIDAIDDDEPDAPEDDDTSDQPEPAHGKLRLAKTAHALPADKPDPSPADPSAADIHGSKSTDAVHPPRMEPVHAALRPTGAASHSLGDMRRPGGPDRPVLPPRPLAPAEEFTEGDHVVYPTHGVGKVERIATEEIAGHRLELIHITFEENRMTLRVPVAKARTAGLRKLATRKVFDDAMGVLKGRARVKRTMWSRRAQEYEAKINSGDPIAIAEVVRDLHRNSGQPDQSFSERQIYEAAMDRLAAELAALDKTDKPTAATKLATFLKSLT